MSRKKVSSTVYLTAAQDAALKRLSARTRAPIAEYIREGIDLAVVKHGQPLNDFDSAADGERFDLPSMLQQRQGLAAVGGKGR